MKDNPRVREAYNALSKVLFNEPLSVRECDIITNALGVLNCYLPEGQ